MRTAIWTMTAALACTALAGCEKSSETEKREADKAAAQAEQKQAQAAKEGEQKAREAQEKAERQRSDFHATVLREKVDYRAKVHGALDKIDKDLVEHKIDVTQITRDDRTKDAALLKGRSEKDSKAIEANLVRRDHLLNLADEIDKTADLDWPAFKERLDRELSDVGKPIKPGRT